MNRSLCGVGCTITNVIVLTHWNSFALLVFLLTFILCFNSQDKENQEDAPENQEDSDANELPETSFQVLFINLHQPVSRFNTFCIGLVQDAENAGKATKEPVRELICTSCLHRYCLQRA